MNHVHAVVLRSAGSCLRSSPWPTPSSTLTHARRIPRSYRLSSTACVGLSEGRTIAPIRCAPQQSHLQRQLSTTTRTTFRAQPASFALGPLKPQAEIEKGLAFGEQPLTDRDLQHIFGIDGPSADPLNRLLRVLHGRRVDGTLDLPFPDDVQEFIDDNPDIVDPALYWLRENYYIDEDEAIVARIEREESGYKGRTPSQLRQRAQDLKLYGPQTGKIDEDRREGKEPEQAQYFGPQSGRYQAKLGEKGDVFGVSEIEKIRARNEAQAKKDEEELDQQIEEIQARRIANAEHERSQAIATRPEQSIESVQEEIRPPNQFEKWVLRAKNRASSKLTLESEEIQKRTLAGRLLPSLAFVVLIGTGCWFLSQSWEPPKRSDRLWPNMSLSFATIAGIIAVNAGIFVLWRFPPAWSLLNRYFLVVPATPRVLSLFGNIFSHVQPKHLLFNMLPLVVFGPSLHEDLGRGNFIALYLACGVFASFASLTHHAVRGILYTSSLGASGSVWAVTAAFFNIHSNNDFTIFFVPDDWKDSAYVKGWVLFSCLIAVDIVGGIRGKPVTVDYVAHATGALAGWVLTEWFKRQKAHAQADGQFVPKTKLPWWQIVLQEGGNQDKGSP